MKVREPKALAIVVVVVAVAVVIILAATAYGSPACMTQGEARQHWPSSHLYWHTLHRCWDNSGPARPTSARKRDRIHIDANANVASVVDVVWYPRPFAWAAEPLDPPVVLGVVEYRWPGSTIMEAPVVVLDPMTIVAEAEFNEIDEGANR
jgi:hypothetical protein